MTITKKMLTLISGLIIVPMLLLLFISSFVLDKQLTNAAENYLQNSSKVFHNAYNSRQEEMIKSSKMLTTSLQIQNSLRENNKESLRARLIDLKSVFPYLDFIVVTDKEGNVVADTPSMDYINPKVFEKMFTESLQKRSATSSPMVVNLDQLFKPGSKEFNQYQVEISSKMRESQYLTKCLTSVTITPIYYQKHLLGFLVIGDILNNDDYFPNVYSNSIEDSFLAISIEGIRVTSNIRSPEQSDLIGSTNPVPMHQLNHREDFYFGRVNIGGEIHMFLDLPLVDHEQKIIGVLGVGIPEDKFSRLVNTNQNIIFGVTALCLLLMLIIGQNTARRLIAPIAAATEFAEQISQGEKEIVIEKSLLRDRKSETTILLKTLQKMASDLKVSKEKIESYLGELQQKNRQQEKLTEQLKSLNDHLEEKVSSRTLDLREAITALQKADEVKSRFLANMSHELRTPLNGIICSSEALKDGIFGDLNQKQHKYIQNILNSSSHLLQIINDILDLSKIQAGKMTLSLGEYSISSIITESFHIVKTMADQKQVEVTFQIRPPDFHVKVDAKKLRQILYNLLSNSIKFTPEYGRVIVEIDRHDEFMKVMIKDTGIGIKEEDQKRVFKEFEQVDGSYERQYEGTGLGLPLTKKLVELHGGEIYLKSKVNQGTEVFFTIPLDVDDYFSR